MTEKWEPVSKGYIDGLIEIAQYEIDEKALALWEMIKLPQPEKWNQNQMGDFWVVGIMGKTCIYYNDIEDGINISKFDTWGEIQDYVCNQITLQDFISCLPF